MKNRMLALGVGCGAVVAQLIWWRDPGVVTRLIIALPFFLIGIGIYRGGRHWLIVAILFISALLLATLSFPLPDREQPLSALPDVTTEFLEMRLCVITAYAMAVLWRLSLAWKRQLRA